ncbi:DUF2076 domain-containing protein [Ewingella sp. S1.OA.A_B6]
MQSEEQRLIEGLFSRLQQAESVTAPRDAEAERVIQACISKQPSAPYYMAQAMIIQEAALTKLNQQVQAQQQQIQQLQEQAKSVRPPSSGFLAGLFGGGSSAQSQPQAAGQSHSGSQPIPGTSGWDNRNAPQQQQPYQQQAAPQQAAPQQPGFLGSALRTAAGVAGGVVLAEMLTGMFHQTQPQEIVNIIQEPPVQNLDPNDTSALDNNDFQQQNFDSGQPDWQDASMSDNNDSAGFGFGADDGSSDDYSNDDDSFF